MDLQYILLQGTITVRTALFSWTRFSGLPSPGRVCVCVCIRVRVCVHACVCWERVHVHTSTGCARPADDTFCQLHVTQLSPV